MTTISRTNGRSTRDCPARQPSAHADIDVREPARLGVTQALKDCAWMVRPAQLQSQVKASTRRTVRQNHRTLASHFAGAMTNNCLACHKRQNFNSLAGGFAAVSLHCLISEARQGIVSARTQQTAICAEAASRDSQSKILPPSQHTAQSGQGRHPRRSARLRGSSGPILGGPFAARRGCGEQHRACGSRVSISWRFSRWLGVRDPQSIANRLPERRSWE
jgi:hypothetical protein